MPRTQPKKFVLCIRNDECEDLEPRKVYLVLPDRKALHDGYLRIMDESGEDYLYPESYFIPISVPTEASNALLFAR